MKYSFDSCVRFSEVGEDQKLTLGSVFFNVPATTEIYSLSLHDALPILFFLFLHQML